MFQLTGFGRLAFAALPFQAAAPRQTRANRRWGRGPARAAAVRVHFTRV